jgi:hypothetical protein
LGLARRGRRGQEAKGMRRTNSNNERKENAYKIGKQMSLSR